MKKYKTKTGMLALFLSASILITGCGGSSEKDEKKTSTKDITESIKNKYAKEEKYTYTDPMTKLDRNHKFKFEFGFDLKENGFDNAQELFQVFSDSSFQYPVGYKIDYNKEDKTMVVDSYKNSTLSIPDEERGGKLHNKGEGEDWGNAQQLYLVKYYDFETAEKLDKPEVTVFDVKTEIEETPEVSFYVSEDGIGGLKWDKVKGADEYTVLKVSYSKLKEGAVTSHEFVEKIATTKDTFWEDSKESGIDKLPNNNFRMFVGKSEDELYAEAKESGISAEEFLKTTEIEEPEIMKDNDYYFVVIASNKEGTSHASNFINQREVAPQVPRQIAYYLNAGGIQKEDFNKVDGDVGLVSSHVWIEMCDGKAVQKLINYNTKNTKVSKETYITGEKEGSTVENPQFESEELDTLSIPFTIDGTAIDGFVWVIDYDKDTYESELKTLLKRQNGLKDKTGGLDKEVDLNNNEKDEDDVSTELNGEYKIFASNALSEYLAIQMLNGETTVNLDAFKESSDQQYLLDAWYEAMYQNPLTLGVRSISYNQKNNNLSITYDDDAKTQREKQVEIEEKVKSITKEIIKDDMTDLEKETAINDYLVENGEYDNAALENAEKNNFKKVDDSFNDSFTAYGILVNNKGVCASYAAAFKLLADEAGLNSVVVTGALDGTLPHAWNRVNLDGEWASLDVTNNDNEYIRNGLFNIPDSVSSKVLVEDDLYVMDIDLPKYTGPSENNEYYRTNGKFFDQMEIVEKLTEGVTNDGKVTLRTTYTLSDEEFKEIAQKVSENSKYSLRGMYYLGVIYLEK